MTLLENNLNNIQPLYEKDNRIEILESRVTILEAENILFKMDMSEFV